MARKSRTKRVAQKEDQMQMEEGFVRDFTDIGFEEPPWVRYRPVIGGVISSIDELQNIRSLGRDAR